MMNTDWMQDAECRNHDPETFFPDRTGPAGQKQAVAAERICQGCPVIVQCGLYRDQLGPQFGVWAGRKTPPSRNIRSERVEPLHGTEAGLKRHQRRGETCLVCREGASRERAIRKEMRAANG